MRWEWVESGARQGLRLHFEDEGPGIADIGMAMTDGYTTTRRAWAWACPAQQAAGQRIPHRHRPRQGTRVSITKWK